MRRWVNNTLRDAWSTLKPTPPAIEPLQLVTDSDGMVDGYKYTALAQYLKGKEDTPDFPGDRSHWLHGLPLEEPEDPARFRQDLVRTALQLFRSLKRPGARFLTVENVTGVKEEPSEEEKEKERVRMERLKARELEDGIVVHIMVRWWGGERRE